MTYYRDPNAVYRAYDADMTLLYVGVSRLLVQRMRHHERDSPWWPEVNVMSAVWYRNRADGEDAEALAIADEKPLHNVRRPKPPAVAPEPLPFKPQFERIVRPIPIKAECEAAAAVARMLGRKWPCGADYRWARQIIGVAAPHIIAADRERQARGLPDEELVMPWAAEDAA